MATWPSGTKASTTNLDAGTDSPASARADLKQNTDNVNSIIDMFNITSPSNDQVLKYNTSNARFELGTAGGSSLTVFTLHISGGTLISGSTYRGNISEIFDPGSVLSISSDQFSLATGTYLILLNGFLNDSAQSFRMYNVTDDINDIQSFDLSSPVGGTVRTSGSAEISLSVGLQSAITMAATKTVEFRYSRSGSGNIQMSVTFIKVA